MIPVFKYTFMKAFVKPSTFVFIGFATLLLSIGPMMSDPSEYSTLMDYVNTQFATINIQNWMFVGTIIFSFYISTKATSFVSDELEDGTLLSIISKPVSRLQIIIGKYAAIIATCLVFIFMLTFLPSSFLAIKAKNPAVIGLVVPVALKQTLFFVLWMLILLSILLPLSIKLGSKVLITIGTLFAVTIAIGSMVIPMVMETTTFGYGLTEGTYHTEEEVQRYEEDISVSTMNWLSYVNVPQHFQIMYGYSSKEMFTGNAFDGFITAPQKPTWEEVEIDGVVMYEFKGNVDYVDPIALYAFYTLVVAGLTAFTVKRFTKNDFM